MHLAGGRESGLALGRAGNDSMVLFPFDRRAAAPHLVAA